MVDGKPQASRMQQEIEFATNLRRVAMKVAYPDPRPVAMAVLLSTATGAAEQPALRLTAPTARSTSPGVDHREENTLARPMPSCRRRCPAPASGLP